MQRLDLFQTYYEETKDFIRLSIYWMVRTSIVDDLVQETYIKAWKNFNGFKNESSFKTWIYRIAMNTTYDYFKSVKSEKKMMDSLDEHYDDVKDVTEYEQLVTEGLKLLTFDQRQAFYLYYRVGYTFNECSHMMNEPESTFKSRLYKARDIFINFLAENGVINEAG